MVRLFASWILLFSLIGLPGGGVKAQDAPALLWTGDHDSARAYMVELAELYLASENVPIEVRYGTTTDALERVIQRESDMGGSARINRDMDAAEAQLTMVPIAWDAITVVVHRDNPVSNLLAREINGILTGSIRNWSQLGWAEGGAIDVARRDDAFAGVEFSLQDMVLAEEPSGGYPGSRVADGNAVFDYVVANPNAIGFALFSQARQRPIKMLSVEGESPRRGSIETGEYLLYQPVYLAHLRNPSKRREIQRFLRFAMSQPAQRVLVRNGIVPYNQGIRLVTQRYDRDRAIRRVLEDEG
jgi:phosphate transport system substrate-binding protein